ncbi:MAG: glycosyltransferase family 4 protein [Fibrobacteria bacterium]|nr:glycosyltransferase family 4 protein [Fibrobacteria bacterium]
MKTVAWLTADYFLDVDLPLVPLLSEKFEIHWFILFGGGSPVEVPNDPSVRKARIFRSERRSRDPLLVLDFIKLLWEIRRTQPDVIYLDIVGLPHFHFLAKALLPTSKVICAVHNVDDYPGWGNRRMMRRYLDWTFRHFCYFHLFSRHTKESFERRAPGKTTFYAPLALKSYGEAERVRDESVVQFLFFGGIRSNKNLDLLLRAYAMLPDQVRSRARLQISGSCPVADRQRYIEQAAGDPSIRFDFRRIPDAEVPRLFLGHHFLILPYSHIAQSGPQMLAYNYRLPVIATDLPGFSERIADREDGYLFRLDDAASLSRALQEAVESHVDRYPRLLESLEKRIQAEFDPEAVAKSYALFFEIPNNHIH